VKTQVRKRGKT